MPILNTSLSGQSSAWCHTGKTTSIRRIAEREAGISRHQGYPIMVTPKIPRTITTLSYLTGPPLCRETGCDFFPRVNEGNCANLQRLAAELDKAFEWLGQVAQRVRGFFAVGHFTVKKH